MRLDLGPSPLTADRVSAFQSRLSASLESDSGLDDHARVEAIRALEELICTATAAQAHLSAELSSSKQAGAAHVIGYARRESPHRAARHLGLARIASHELPHTWSAWRRGLITEWQATLIARETACLSLLDRLAVDRAIAENADRLSDLGDGPLVRALQSEAYRLDPESFVTRRRRAEADRRVSLRPAPDTMTWLTALLPVKDGVAVLAALSSAADSAISEGDTRSRGQLMADRLVSQTTSCAGSESMSRRIELGLVMTDAALFGESDEPARLNFYGPIPAELGREIVAHALTAGERVWVRRLYTHPKSGELTAMDSRSRRFRASLGRFIRLRDQFCRTPWCGAPIRHLDHALEHQDSGPTSADNGQGLCQSCNHAKQGPGWRAGPAPGGGIETILPTGQRYVTRPPTLVRIRELEGPPITIDWVIPRAG